MADLNKAKFLYFKTSAVYEAAKANMAVGAIAFDAASKHIYVKAAASGADTEYWIGGDIINNLTSDDASAKLSAAQGKALKALIDSADSSITGLISRMNTAENNISALDSSVTALDASVKDHETRVGAIEILDTKMQAAIVAVAKACAANELEGFSGDNTVDICAGSVDASTVDGSIMDGVTKAKIKVRIKSNGGITQDENGIFVDGTKLYNIPQSGVVNLEASLGALASADTAEASARAAADASEAAERKYDVSTLKAADASLKTYVDNSLNLKVNVADSSNFTYSEKTKLSGIEDNAQVNKIETVKVNGSTLKITDKAVDITVPAATVTGVKDGDKVLKLNGTILETGLSMNYDSSSKRIYLKGLDGSIISTVDATPFIKDALLEKVELKTDDGSAGQHPKENGPYLVFTFKVDEEGKQQETIWLSVKTLVDIYTVKDDSSTYLDISAYKVGAKVEVEHGLAGFDHLVKTDTSLADVSSRFNTFKGSAETSIGLLENKDVQIDSSIVRIDASLVRLDGDATVVGSIKKQIADASKATEEKLIGNDTDASTASTIYGAKAFATAVATKAAEDVSVKLTGSGDDYISVDPSSTKSGNTTTLTANVTATNALKIAIANANNALQKIKVNGTEITPDSSAVNITVATGDANGQIKVAGQNIDVKGLGTAAYTTVAALESTMETKDNNVKTTLIGNTDDASTADTINGAKNLAKQYTDAATAWYVES